MPPGRIGGDRRSIAGRACSRRSRRCRRAPAASTPYIARQRWMRGLLAAQPARSWCRRGGLVTLDRLFRLSHADRAAVARPLGDASSPRRPPSSRDSRPRLPVGRSAGRLTLEVAEPLRQPTSLRNVAGLLRGSDPALSGTYVLVSAHYDGTGPPPGDTGPDRIWNGANDDGSGTATVVELASAFARLRARPRRSIVLRGLLRGGEGAPRLLLLRRASAGAAREDGGERQHRAPRPHGRHRTQQGGHGQPDRLRLLGRAARSSRRRGGRRGSRSTGTPAGPAPSSRPATTTRSRASASIAHTVCVVFEDFADYHGAGDEWPKIDFANMERTARMVGAAVLMIADATDEPRWRPEVEEAAPYLAAWERLCLVRRAATDNG